MSSERRSMPEQELSIKEREQELFVDPLETPTSESRVKPFPIYLRETPAVPMSSGVKLILWIVGISVVLIFCVAIWRARRPPRPLQAPGAPKAAMRNVTLSSPQMAGASRGMPRAWLNAPVQDLASSLAVLNNHQSSSYDGFRESFQSARGSFAGGKNGPSFLTLIHRVAPAATAGSSVHAGSWPQVPNSGRRDESWDWRR
jgi:hypothetical protein